MLGNKRGEQNCHMWHLFPVLCHFMLGIQNLNASNIQNRREIESIGLALSHQHACCAVGNLVIRQHANIQSLHTVWNITAHQELQLVEFLLLLLLSLSVFPCSSFANHFFFFKMQLALRGSYINQSLEFHSVIMGK